MYCLKKWNLFRQYYKISPVFFYQGMCLNKDGLKLKESLQEGQEKIKEFKWVIFNQDKIWFRLNFYYKGKPRRIEDSFRPGPEEFRTLVSPVRLPSQKK